MARDRDFAATCAAPQHRPSPWFSRTFTLVCAAALGGFCWETLTRPMSVLFTGDSFGYVMPGIDLAGASTSAQGQSTRDLGYPLLTWFSLRLGSLLTLPRLQLVLVACGLICLLYCLHAALRALACRLTAVLGLPAWPMTIFASAAAATYLAVLVVHDRFIVDIYALMAEAPHLLPTAAALSGLVAGLIAVSPRRRLALLMMATLAAYLSIMVKPHSSLAVVLCGGCLIVVALRHPAAIVSARVIGVGVACLGLGAATYGFDRWITPPGYDFGPKTLFCNHLDVILPSFDQSTPQRVEVARLARQVLNSPEKWTLMGFDGDLCYYNNAFSDAISAAAKSEDTPVSTWQRNEFVKGVLTNPIRYKRDVIRQLKFFFSHAATDSDYSEKSSISDWDWQRLHASQDLIPLSRADLEHQVANWVPAAYPAETATLKSLLHSIEESFAVATLGSSALALVGLFLFRKKDGARAEVVLLVTGAFTLCLALTTAMAHTFDFGRYIVDILPFSLLWWMMGFTYTVCAVLSLVALAAQYVYRLSRRRRARESTGHLALGARRLTGPTRPAPFGVRRVTLTGF